MNSYIIYMDDTIIEFYNDKGDMDTLLLAKVPYNISNKLEQFNNADMGILIEILEDEISSIYI